MVRANQGGHLVCPPDDVSVVDFGPEVEREASSRLGGDLITSVVLDTSHEEGQETGGDDRCRPAPARHRYLTERSAQRFLAC